MAKILLKGSERAAVPGARVVAPADPAGAAGSERARAPPRPARRCRRASAALAAGKRIGASEPGGIRARARRRSGRFRARALVCRGSGTCGGAGACGATHRDSVGHRRAVQRGLRRPTAPDVACRRHAIAAAPAASTCPPNGTAWSRRFSGSTTGRRREPHFRTRPPSAMSIGARRRAGLLHTAAGGRALRLSERHRRGPVRGAHRTRRRISGPRISAPISAAWASRRPPSRRCRSITARTARPAMPSGPDGEVMLDIEVVGRDRARRKHRGLFRAEHRRRLSRRHHHRDSRHDQQSFRDFNQLGRRGVDLDVAGDDRHGRGVPGGGDPGHYRVRRLRRQRLLATA